MSAPAAPRPARSRIASASTRQRQPRGLRPEPDRDGRHERAEQDEPARLDRRRGRRRLAGRRGRTLADNRRQENGLRGQRGGKSRGVAHRTRGRHPEKRRHHREGRRDGRPAEPLADPQRPQSSRGKRRDRRRARRVRQTAAARRTPTAPRTARPRRPAPGVRRARGSRPSRGPCRWDSPADAAGGGRDRNHAGRGRSSPSRRLRAWRRETADGPAGRRSPARPRPTTPGSLA